MESVGGLIGWFFGKVDSDVALWGWCGGSLSESVGVLLVVVLLGLVACFPDVFPGAVVDFGR